MRRTIVATNRTPRPRTLSPEVPVVSYPTPNLDDLLVIEDVDARIPGYTPLEYGDLHPDQTLYPGLKLVFQSPLDQDANHMWVRRVYAKDRQDEDAYNFAIRYSDNNPAYPIYVRTYTSLRSEYAPLAAGAPDPVFPSAFLISEEVVRFKGDAENDALDSLYVKVLRVFETLPGPSVKRYETNESGQTVEVTTRRKLSGPSYVPPVADAVTSFSSELAEENVITDTVRKLPEVFDAKLFSAEVPDPAPQKFRIAAPAVTEEQTVTGTAASPVLATGEFSKSEQQQTKFTKRTRKTSRSAQSLPKSLTQTSTTRQKQKATVTETLQVGNTTETPSATVDIESEALGDGTFVVRKTQVPKVFDAKTEVATKPDVVPPRFTAKLPTKTVTETKEGASITSPTLGADDYRKEAERISEFEVRTSTVTRDGKLPSLSGKELEEAYNVQIPYTETIQNTSNATGSSEVEPLSADQYLVRTYNPTELDSVLRGYAVQYPTRITLDLPRVLRSATVKMSKSESFSEFENENSLSGTFRAFSQGDTGALAVSGTLTPEFVLEYEDIWASNLPATTHIFFLKEPITANTIISKLGCQEWPTFSPRGHVITAEAKTKTKKLTAALSRGQSIANEQQGLQFSKSDSIDETNESRAIVVNIPPCLHSSIRLNATERINLNKSFSIRYQSLTGTGGFSDIPEVMIQKNLQLNLDNRVNETLNATNPPNVPRSGKYLTDCRVEFFKYGWFIIQATVFDASKLGSSR